MPEQTRASRQGVVPMINYADGPAAMDWLAEAFGFVEQARWVDDGMLSHGEMIAGDGVIMMATGTRDYEGPRAHREHCAAAAAWSKVPYTIDGVLVYVPDVDGHCARAREKGAVILSEPGDSPWGRQYRAEDVEGHRWMFLERPS
ncbi:VOC family protein [Micromonospora sp. FIMYZ51]|uniref:VOC family protein n=1 Tax=Micromonospora sp. FIMYZ51 TaxID=3051832 RepID=UPI00311FC763